MFTDTTNTRSTVRYLTARLAKAADSSTDEYWNLVHQLDVAEGHTPRGQRGPWT